MYPVEPPAITNPPNARPIFLKSEIIGNASFFFGTSVGASSPWLSVIDSRPDAFETQKAAFLAIPPLMLVPYAGHWVVSRNGEIVDSDSDLQRLSGRFFGANGKVDVYICQVGNDEPALIRTPFLR